MTESLYELGEAIENLGCEVNDSDLASDLKNQIDEKLWAMDGILDEIRALLRDS